MCSGEENLKAAVPWGDVIHDPWAFFDGTHWPAAVQLKEPSKINKADATTVLDFWFDRQKNDMQLAFSFKAWKDSNGEMQEADLWPPSAHRANATKQSTGKGKGKANPKANRRRVLQGSVTPARAPALPTPAPALLDSPRGGALPAPRKTAVWTAMTPPLAL
ncbi:uncharacterized protein F5147DRAFT_776286 [Suillus discolor]|uniref:Uncharacterized protein n=1 Tax=Suillus discolor TaxID=1912936 RepID=A0A9P7JRM4_9AGAM|nr:uncharacterized protein F5147DRAFT_776286 [Suillus discolor]KAG2102539.1 hypothetical protein F5147DRAFT_776286 [Suillus discolor]